MTCKILGCEEDVWDRGYCKKHLAERRITDEKIKKLEAEDKKKELEEENYED